MLIGYVPFQAIEIQIIFNKLFPQQCKGNEFIVFSK